MKKIIYFIFAVVLFTGCSQKSEISNEYNKPAVYWYNQILKQISMNQIDQADDTFTSLESEHRNSPLIQPAMMILVKAHMDEEEYEMANYYLDEYAKRYALSRNMDQIFYLKIKVKFMSFGSKFRDQELIMRILDEIKEFKVNYSDSEYIYLVNTIEARVLMTKSTFDKEISELYKRVGKEEASKVYDQKARDTFKDQESIVTPETPLLQDIFENGVF
jgi:outer membrane protein assembly factor BamD